MIDLSLSNQTRIHVAGLITSISLLGCGGGGGNSSDTPAVTSPPAAAKLLQQASFGGTKADIDGVVAKGVTAWVDEQLSMPSAYDSSADGWKTHLERTIEIAQQAEPNTNFYGTTVFNESTADGDVDEYQMAVWWENVLGATKAGYEKIGSDPLRQRVAYALSQILVVSNSSGLLARRGEGLADYYDMLARNAFGNFRTLIGEMARHPAMGVYLSHQGNQKADPTKGTRPDENFARELMQLFTVGLYQLNVDGSPNRDGDRNSYPDAGTNLVPSYTQVDVEELAKVMTGWDLVDNSRYGKASFRDGNYTVPMEFTAAEHEDEIAEGGDGMVTLLGTTFALNSGTDGSGMDAALDVLFNHSNTGPFISKLLIQRLTSSNPSSAYVARVTAVFENNGEGQRGDLKAVVRAILLDAEATTSTETLKFKEPMLGFVHLLKAAHVKPMDGWRSRQDVPMTDVYWFRHPQIYAGQAPLRSPSVFNFYSPTFVPSDPNFSNSGKTAPEAQIMTSQMLVNYVNIFYQLLHTYEKTKITVRDGNTIAAYAATRTHSSSTPVLTDLSEELALFEMAMEGDTNGDYAAIDDTATDADGNTPKGKGVDALITYLDLVLTGQTMTDEYKAALKHYLLDASGTNLNSANKVEEARLVVRDAFHLIAASGLFAR